MSDVSLGALLMDRQAVVVRLCRWMKMVLLWLVAYTLVAYLGTKSCDCCVASKAKCMS